MSLIDQIKRVANYHGSATYNVVEHRWNFSKIAETRKGVYIFVEKGGNDILKIGKADGKMGISQRANEYRANSRGFLTIPSSSASVIKRMQETELRQLEIEIYYIPIDPVQMTVAGFNVLASPARELEHALHTTAREEGHSLRFSKQR